MKAIETVSKKLSPVSWRRRNRGFQAYESGWTGERGFIGIVVDDWRQSVERRGWVT